MAGEDCFLLRIDGIETLGIDAIGNHVHVPFQSIDDLPVPAEVGSEIALGCIAWVPQDTARIRRDGYAAAAFYVDRLASKGLPMAAAISGVRRTNGWAERLAQPATTYDHVRLVAGIIHII